jgi:hypothetical protein
MLATKTVASHLKARKEGRWKAMTDAQGPVRSGAQCTYFSTMMNKTEQ